MFLFATINTIFKIIGIYSSISDSVGTIDASFCRFMKRMAPVVLI